MTRPQKAFICQYCKQRPEIVGGDVIYPHRPDLSEKQFYLCRPCRAFVACHPITGKPLGILANSELRAAKKRAFAAFDQLWMNGPISRRKAYLVLAYWLQKDPAVSHIGLFNLATCKRVEEVCLGKMPLDEEAYQLALTWAKCAYPLRRRRQR